MEKEFVPYEIALELKELGYNEGSLACFITDGFNVFDTVVNYNSNPKFPECYDAPTFSSAFRWFREKYNKDSFIARCNSTKEYFFDISWRNKKGLLKDFQSKDFKTHPEAELECVRRLIKITKEKLVQTK